MRDACAFRVAERRDRIGVQGDEEVLPRRQAARLGVMDEQEVSGADVRMTGTVEVAG